MKRRKIITGTRKVLENVYKKPISTICLDDDEKSMRKKLEIFVE